MSIHQIRLYDLFRRDLHLPDEKAAAFVVSIEETVRSENEKVNQPLVANMDSMKEDIITIKADIKDLRKDIADLRTNMGNMHKSIYQIGIVQFIAIVGSVMAIVKFIK